jgi:hypothetical protein
VLERNVPHFLYVLHNAFGTSDYIALNARMDGE